MLVSFDDTVLADIKVALQFVGRPNLQKQGRAAHILLRYAPSYSTFSAAEHIPIPSGEDHLTALIFLSFKNIKEVGLEASKSEQEEEQAADPIAENLNQSEVEIEEALNSAFEEARLNSSDPPPASSQGDFFEDIFTNLRDLPGSYPDNMAGESLTQMAKQRNAKRMAARRRAEAEQNQPLPPPPDAREETPPVLVEEVAQNEMSETKTVVDQQEG